MHGRKLRIGCTLRAAAVIVSLWSTWNPVGAAASLPALRTADATTPGASAQLAGLGRHRGESSAFKPDPIYGGGRGKDPYGSPLESDPYKAGGVLKERANRPPNSFFGPGNRQGKKEDKDEAEPPPQRTRMNPEDRQQENRANRAAREDNSEESEEK